MSRSVGFTRRSVGFTRGHVAVLALVVLVGFAGCNAFSGSSGGNAQVGAPAGNATAAPVPTDAPTPTPGPGDVPGLARAGVENGSALVAAHADALENRSFTIQYDSTFVFENGTVADSTNSTSQVGSDGRIFNRLYLADPFGVGRDAGDPVATERWIEDGQSLRASIYENGSQRYSRVGPELATNRSQVVRVYASPVEDLATNSSRVVGRDRRANTTLYRIEGQTSPSPDSDNQNISVLVDARGRVHEVRLTFNFGSNLSERIRVRYTDVGTTSVERPAWYEEAVANATTPRARAPDREASEERTPPPELLPVPGVSKAGIEDNDALLAAHAESFRNTSVTIRSDSTTRLANGTVAWTGNTTAWLGRDSRRRVRSTYDQPSASNRGPEFVAIERWRSAERSLVATTLANGSRRYSRPPSSQDTDRHDLLLGPVSVIDALDAEHSHVVARIQRENTTLYRIAGELPAPGDSNASISILVDSAGRIHEYHATRLAIGLNRTREVTIRYTGVGTTSVERPAWYDAALANVTTPTERYPRGLDEGGVTDARALARSHAAALDGTSFTYRSTTIQRDGDGQRLLERARTGRFGRRSQHYYATIDATHSTTERSRHREVWTNGGRIIVAATTPTGTEYDVLRRLNDPSVDRPNRSSALLFDPTRQRDLTGLLAAMNVSVTDGDRPGTHQLRGSLRHATSFTASRLSLRQVQNATLSAVVADTGLIRRYRFSYTGVNQAGVVVEGTSEVVYSAVGSTDVGRPPWYRAGVENVSHASGEQ